MSGSGFVRSNAVRQARPVQIAQSAPAVQSSDATAASPQLASASPTPISIFSSLPPALRPVSNPSTSNLPSSPSTTLPSSLLPSTSPPPPPSLPLPGTRAWLHSLSFISTGIVDLDLLLSGGFFLHSLVSLSDDPHALPFLRSFLADGLHHHHRLITLSSSPTPSSLLSYLPKPSRDPPPTPPPSSLTIAWRYSTPSFDRSKRHLSMSQSYDLTHYQPPPSHPHHHHIQALNYRQAYCELASVLAEGRGEGCVTRIVIQSLGDVDWGYETSEEASGLLAFLHGLRGLLHLYPAVCLFTFPSSIYSPSITRAVHHLCQLSLLLHTLPPSSPYSVDASALLTFLPPAPFHSLTPLMPPSEDYLVGVRGRLVLSKLSLPPEEGGREGEKGVKEEKERGRVEVEGEGRKVEEKKKAVGPPLGMGCGSVGGKNVLDF